MTTLAMAGTTIANEHAAAAVEALLEDARTFDAERPAPAWLVETRRKGRALFRELGFPAATDEDWRYTNVAPLFRRALRVVDSRVPETTPVPSLVREMVRKAFPSPRLVFVGGRLAPELSSRDGLPHGVQLVSLAELDPTRPSEIVPLPSRVAATARLPFVAMNDAFLQDGVRLVIPPHCVVKDPISLVYIAAADPSAGEEDPLPTVPLRTWLCIGEGGQATVHEAYLGGPGRSFTNAVSEIELGSSAALTHVKLVDEGFESTHIGTTCCRLSRSSRLVSTLVSFGAKLARNEMHVELDGEGAEAVLNGLFRVGGTQHVDNHTVVDHARPHGSSRQLYKGILDGRARGIFDGKVIVRPGAQKTDAHQKNRNLLLSPDASVDSKPQLEIDNNDVRCTHGSATGRLDADAVFYLRSRGLSEEDARRLLTFAFGSEILREIAAPALRQALEERLLQTAAASMDPQPQSQSQTQSQRSGGRHEP